MAGFVTRICITLTKIADTFKHIMFERGSLVSILIDSEQASLWLMANSVTENLKIDSATRLYYAIVECT